MMPDLGSQDEAPAGARALQYPFGAPPGHGASMEVAPGVHWLRMPLPFALDHINVWAIDEADGCAIVDTGLRTEETQQAWDVFFAADPRHASISRVLVTHMHPDHVGMAGWLTRRFGVRIWMTRLEYLTCRVMVSDNGREAPADGIDFYRRAGWSPAALETYRARFGNFGRNIHALPDSFQRLRDGDELTFGRHVWRIVVGNGHSPEHACMYCPELKVFISGDQVLPRISSNVSVYPTEPEADPLSDWLESLDKLQREVPDDVLVLPAHNECFRGLHARIDALRHGQRVALERLRRALQAPARAVDVFGALFARPVGENDGARFGFATGESVACLNHLLRRGEVRRQIDRHGVAWYRLAA